MPNLAKSVLVATASLLFVLPTAASADSAPKIAIGNGAPLTGSNNSLIGVAVLTPEANRTPISVRLLGSDKLLGLSVRPADSKTKTLYLKVAPSLDTNLNLNVPK